MIDLRDPAERDAVAGEFVLGTLSAEDRAAVEAALPGNAALRAAVYAWQDRLLALTAHAPAVPPSPALWPRLEAALAWRDLPARAAPARAPWWRGLRFWQGLGALSVAASLVLALRLVAPLPTVDAPRYVAVLESPDDRRAAGWVVEVQAGGALRLVPVGDAPVVPAGRALQFWTKPQGAAGPTSLGLVRPGEVVQMPVTRLPGVGAQQLFEITLEPEAGSPIGRPTGPILAVGRTVAL